MARGGQQRAAELMAEAEDREVCSLGIAWHSGESPIIHVNIWGHLEAPGQENIADRSPMKPIVIKEEDQFERAAREARGQCLRRGVWTAGFQGK